MYRNTTPILTLTLILLSLITTGCATVTKGSSQSVTVSTDPPGASCTLSREGATIGAVSQTPGTIQLEKDKDAITVLCKKPGYFDATGVLSSEFQGMTFGNILIGGLIGVAVDGISGAMHYYPPMISLSLTPEAFDSVDTRDQFFNRQKTELLEEQNRIIDSIRKNCGENDGCSGQIQATKEMTDSKLALLEQKRVQARVRQQQGSGPQ